MFPRIWGALQICYVGAKWAGCTIVRRQNAWLCLFSVVLAYSIRRDQHETGGSAEGWEGAYTVLLGDVFR